MVHEFDRRRHLVYEGLNQIEGFNFPMPKGAFYVFPNVRRMGLSSEKVAEFLIQKAQVATVPGSAFGCYGENYLRISYATAYEQLQEALDRIKRSVKRLK
jgi:aminotransferase